MFRVTDSFLFVRFIGVLFHKKVKTSGNEEVNYYFILSL